MEYFTRENAFLPIEISVCTNYLTCTVYTLTWPDLLITCALSETFLIVE